MDARLFRQVLEALTVTQVEFAKFMDVAPRTVNQWAAEGSGPPRPIVVYLRLLLALPAEMRAVEVARIKDQEAAMHPSLYMIEYAGIAGPGAGALVFSGGRITGSDSAGGKYDGVCQPHPSKPGVFDAKIRVTVPPNVPMVTGAPPAGFGYVFDVNATFQHGGKTEFQVQTPTGPVNVRATFMRTLP